MILNLVATMLPLLISNIELQSLGWCVFALSLTVLVQYVFEVRCRTTYRNGLACAEQARNLAHADRDAARDERDVVLTQFNDAKRDFTLLRLENHILRDFVAISQIDEMVDLLLRRMVPATATGFAAIIERDETGTRCQWSRGLSTESLATLQVSESEFQLVGQKTSIKLTGQSLRDSSIFSSIVPADARKAESLHLIAFGETQSPGGLLATTHLCPTTASPQQQAELAYRLLSCLAGHVRKARQLRDREQHLRIAKDLLELRSVADCKFTQSADFMVAYLKALREKTASNGLALYLFESNGALNPKPAARAGGPVPNGNSHPGLTSCWQEFELTLARLSIAVDRPRRIGPDELPRYGVDRLMRAALVVPMIRDRRLWGIVVATRGEAIPFRDDDESLMLPALTFLGETLPRIADQVATERQARLDGLTGLANRRQFDLQLSAAIDQARLTGNDVSLLLCDLDRFKSVNDTYGHLAGDAVLRTAAQVLREQAQRSRSCDQILIARYGGEELAVLLPGFPASGAMRIGELIRAAIQNTPTIYEQQTLNVTVSIGAASLPLHCDSETTLIARADEALYQAKSSGRNRVCLSAGLPSRPSNPESTTCPSSLTSFRE